MPPGSSGVKLVISPDSPGRQVRPSKLENTGPRQYRNAGGGVGPSKSTRSATVSDSVSSPIWPGAIESDSPVLAPWSAGRPHSGAARRGNSTNSSAATGSPCSIITALRRIAARHLNAGASVAPLPVSTSSATPTSTTAGSAAIAASSDWL